MRTTASLVYRSARGLLRAALGFYFSRIQRFHPRRVPSAGPVLFASNHPNSLTDAFVIGAAVPRKVNFIATVRLFQFRPLRALLRELGVIPINRVKDDPRAMRTVFDTFEECFRVLERGEAVGIFPEGLTHDDPQLKTVRTGTARMALELEQRHAGKLGLQIVPVGLTFSAKERYRSDVLVHFGEPIRVAAFLEGFPEKKHDSIHRLTLEIERRIEALILHIPRLERARIVESVKRLYLDRLKVANRVIHEPVPPQVGELRLTQAIASAVDFTCEHHPERAAGFARKLDEYQRRLRRLHLADAELKHFPDKAHLLWNSLAWTGLGVLLLPVAAFGWMHRLLPVLVIREAIDRFSDKTRDKTHVSTVALLAGLVSFSLFYGGYVAVFEMFFGWRAAIWYALSLAPASLVAHYYLRGLRRFITSMRCACVLLRAPSVARRLLALRHELITEIEEARWQVPITALPEQSGAAP